MAEFARRVRRFKRQVINWIAGKPRILTQKFLDRCPAHQLQRLAPTLLILPVVHRRAHPARSKAMSSVSHRRSRQVLLREVVAGLGSVRIKESFASGRARDYRPIMIHREPPGPVSMTGGRQAGENAERTGCRAAVAGPPACILGRSIVAARRPCGPAAIVPPKPAGFPPQRPPKFTQPPEISDNSGWWRGLDLNQRRR